MDQWQRFESMSHEKLMDEMQNLNKKLFKLRPGSPMYSQMKDVISMASQIYRDKLMVSSISEDATKIIDIGEVDSDHGQPNYGADTVDIEVESYYSNDTGNKR